MEGINQINLYISQINEMNDTATCSVLWSIYRVRIYSKLEGAPSWCKVVSVAGHETSNHWASIWVIKSR